MDPSSDLSYRKGRVAYVKKNYNLRDLRVGLRLGVSRQTAISMGPLRTEDIVIAVTYLFPKFSLPSSSFRFSL